MMMLKSDELEPYIDPSIYLFLEKVLPVLQSSKQVLLVFMFQVVTRWLEVANQILQT